MKIHHIGYLVRKMERALAAFEELGYCRKTTLITDDYRKIQICFLQKDGYVIELISPLAEESAVSSLMKKLGNSPYHICYESENFDEDVQQLQHNGYMICSEKHEAVAFDNRNVCFMIHPYLGMIELAEV